MAGKLFITKQFKPRVMIENIRYKKITAQILNRDMFLPNNISNILNYACKIKSISKIHSRCRISGRGRANLNKFKMSRMVAKKYSEFGMLNGIKKASW